MKSSGATFFLVFALLATFAIQAAAELDSRVDNVARVVSKSPQGSSHATDYRTIAGRRQGGEDVASAVTIPGIPFEDTGTTCGYELDYPEFCPSESHGPDVVYVYTATADIDITIDLCLSSYDTMLFIYDEFLQFVACNDDYYFDEGDPCGAWNSKIERASLIQGGIYYVVVGGYATCGDYQITVTEYEPCVLDCAGIPEGEPSLYDGYVDEFNSGCIGDTPVFQSLQGDGNGDVVFCGKSGWYGGPGGTELRDTDWFVATIGPTGTVEWTVETAERSYALLLAPLDCENVGVVDQLTLAKCSPLNLSIQGQPGDSIWLWVGPTTFEPPAGFVGHEFDYLFTLSGLEGVVAIESISFGALKDLFR